MSGVHKLNPGSDDARQQGCVCDPQEPETEDGPNGELLRRWACEPMCPVHGLAVMHALFHDEDGA